MTAPSSLPSTPTETQNDEPMAPDAFDLDSRFDQTRFAEDTVVDGVSTAQERRVMAETAATNSITFRHNPKLVALAALGVLVLVVLPILSLLTRQAVQTMQQSSATPTPIPLVGVQTELEKRLVQLEMDVAEADPSQLNVAYPPVSFELDLEDANSQKRLEEQRRGR